MHAVEAGIGLRMVYALVRAAALGPVEAGGRHEAREREGVLGQLAQAVGAAAQAGVAPQAGSRPVRRARRHLARVARGRSGRLGLRHGRASRAPAEYEALRQRVRGEPVRAVEPGAGTLAYGVEAR